MQQMIITSRGIKAICVSKTATVCRKCYVVEKKLTGSKPLHGSKIIVS